MCFSARWTICVDTYSYVAFCLFIIAQNDYSSITTEICFSPGTSEQTVVVPILNDDLHEPTESFLARLSLPAGQAGVLLDPDTATVTIEDDDGKTHLCHKAFQIHLHEK